jgi:hypothetical protein
MSENDWLAGNVDLAQQQRLVNWKIWWPRRIERSVQQAALEQFEMPLVMSEIYKKDVLSDISCVVRLQPSEHLK